MMDKNVVLERYFPDCRCMLLELAATLDRLDRALPGPATTTADERRQQLHQMIGILAEPDARANRSARMLELLSGPIG